MRTYSRAAPRAVAGLTRVQAGLKSSLIMQEESTSQRARTLASDWYYLGRVRSFDEIATAINSLSPKKIVNHLRRAPPRDFNQPAIRRGV